MPANMRQQDGDAGCHRARAQGRRGVKGPLGRGSGQGDTTRRRPVAGATTRLRRPLERQRATGTSSERRRDRSSAGRKVATADRARARSLPSEPVGAGGAPIGGVSCRANSARVSGGCQVRPGACPPHRPRRPIAHQPPTAPPTPAPDPSHPRPVSLCPQPCLCSPSCPCSPAERARSPVDAARSRHGRAPWQGCGTKRPAGRSTRRWRVHAGLFCRDTVAAAPRRLPRIPAGS